jgi:hypothetical protein
MHGTDPLFAPQPGDRWDANDCWYLSVLLPIHIFIRTGFSLSSSIPLMKGLRLGWERQNGEVERKAPQPRARQRHLKRGEPPATRIMMSGLGLHP